MYTNDTRTDFKKFKILKTKPSIIKDSILSEPDTKNYPLELLNP